MKNKHLEHLEDDILNNGSDGGKTSIAFLKSLVLLSLYPALQIYFIALPR